MKTLLSILCLFIGLTALAQKKPAANTELDKKVKDFDTYAAAALKQWNVPGASMAIVKDGKVVYVKGFGVRELGKNDAVNTETLFSIGSTTKAMTAVCMGMLVDEGKVKWDDKVITYLPEYQLYDPWVTRELRIRDLFLHNSGVGNADFVWTIMDITPAEILQKMRDVQPSYSMRSSFIYQNIFYIAAGEVIQKITGKPWEVFVQERIFVPLGMTRTVPRMKFIKDNNYTKPHTTVENVIQPIGHTKDDAVGAAGAVWSSIDDMAKWAVCMLDSSKYGSARLLKPGTWVEMFKPQTLVPPSQMYPTMSILKPNWTTYGLGWFQHDYKGKKINYHTGSLAGLIAINAQLPEYNLGFYFLGNMDHAEVRHALVYRCFDTFALGGTRDWSTEFKSLYGKLSAAGEKAEKDFEAKRVANTQPSHPLTAYAGTYTHPLYGTAEVKVQGNQLVVGINNNILTATLDHWHYDTFRGWYDKKWYGKENVSFILGADGSVASMDFGGIELKKK